MTMARSATAAVEIDSLFIEIFLTVTVPESDYLGGAVG
jgi:hypothetical protein